MNKSIFNLRLVQRTCTMFGGPTEVYRLLPTLRRYHSMKVSFDVMTSVVCHSKCFYSKFAPQHISTTNIVTPQMLTQDKAYELVLSLKESERLSLKSALEKYDAIRLKEDLAGKLAATRWRTKFARRATVQSLANVDPTGSFCPFPEDWLRKKAEQNAKAPSNQDLYKLFLINAVPFIGFGFLDNFIMIMAGDSIEYLFGTFMCLSTMAAAGLGNTISDIVGIGSAHYVERFCGFMGLKPPDLLPIQMEMKSSLRSANMGRIIGITIGCLLGMFPLVLLKTGDEHDTKKKREKTIKETNEKS